MILRILKLRTKNFFSPIFFVLFFFMVEVFKREKNAKLTVHFAILWFKNRGKRFGIRENMWWARTWSNSIPNLANSFTSVTCALNESLESLIQVCPKYTMGSILQYKNSNVLGSSSIWTCRILNICCCFLQAGVVEKFKTNIRNSTRPNRATKDKKL